METIDLNLTTIERVYFLGIGGIGMSALARYFMYHGKVVAGFDQTETTLTRLLETEGANIHYSDSPALIPEQFQHFDERTLVIYTPALPQNAEEIAYFRSLGYRLYKRAEVLGVLARSYRVFAVSGAHGKTTTTTLLMYLLSQSQGCDAFMGGISLNVDSNLYLGDKGQHNLVVEADEYDRSFLQLNPYVTIVTSMAADHLDVYGTFDNLVQTFRQFAKQNVRNQIIVQQSAQEYFLDQGLEITTYGYTDDCDYWASDIVGKGGQTRFVFHGRYEAFEVELGIPGNYNVENAMAALIACAQVGIDLKAIIPTLRDFRGVQRRYEICYESDKMVYIDDYAHHPDELKSIISATRKRYPNRRLTGIFQPHLYTRTRDFAHDFAFALSDLHTLLLLPIYSAREEPIAGVSSEMLLELVPSHVEKMLVQPKELPQVLMALPIEILLTLGAGNIGAMTTSIVETLKRKDAQR